MDQLSIFFKGLLAFCGGLLGYLYGGWSDGLYLLVAFVSFDYITGIIAAGKEGLLDPKTGYYGVFKKLFIFIMVAIAHLLDQTLNQHILMLASIFWYAGQEFLSITKNFARLGVPVPDMLTNAMANLPNVNQTPAAPGGTTDGK